MPLNEIFQSNSRTMEKLPQSLGPPNRPIGATKDYPIKTFEHPIDVFRMPLHRRLGFHPKPCHHQKILVPALPG